MKQQIDQPDIIIDSGNPLGLPEQIKQEICRKIREGFFKPGEKLPSENKLALLSNVSRMTARQALTTLVQEGIAYRRMGQGTFVANKVEKRSLKKDGPLALVIHTDKETAHQLRHFQEYAFSKEKCVLVFNMHKDHQDPEKERKILQQCQENNVSGIALFPTPLEDNSWFYKKLRDSGISVVLMGHSKMDMHEEEYCLPDCQSAGYLIGKHIMDTGYRHIVLLGPIKSTEIYARHLYTGVKEACVEADYDWTKTREIDFYRFAPRSKHLGDMKIVREIFTPLCRPGTVFVCNNPVKAERVIEVLQIMDLKVPDEFGVITYDLNNDIENITSVHGNPDELAEKAVDILLNESRDINSSQQMVQPVFVQGDTTRVKNR